MNNKITLLRHGSVEKTFGDHRKHLLSDEGRRQASACREKLGNPRFDCVLHSPLERTRETARIVAGLEEDEATTVIRPLFYDATHPGVGVLDMAFRRLHHDSLSEYYKLPNVRKHMEALALDAFALLDVEIKCRNAKEILVVGHCVLLLALCAVIADNDEPFMSRVLGECEGYRIQMEKGRASSIEPI
ncbi:MAG: histidine phosphatase family protein [Patescibacteria group bacterium]